MSKNMVTVFFSDILPQMKEQMPQIKEFLKPVFLKQIFKEAKNLEKIVKYLETCVKHRDYNYSKHIDIIKLLSPWAYTFIYEHPEIFAMFINHFKDQDSEMTNFFAGLLRRISKQENIDVSND